MFGEKNLTLSSLLEFTLAVYTDPVVFDCLIKSQWLKKDRLVLPQTKSNCSDLNLKSCNYGIYHIGKPGSPECLEDSMTRLGVDMLAPLVCVGLKCLLLMAFLGELMPYFALCLLCKTALNIGKTTCTLQFYHHENHIRQKRRHAHHVRGDWTDVNERCALLCSHTLTQLVMQLLFNRSTNLYVMIT